MRAKTTPKKKFKRGDYYTTQEACEALDVHRCTLYRYDIPRITIKGRTYWHKKATDAHQMWA